MTEKLYRDWAAMYDAVSTVVSLGNWQRWRRRSLAYVTGENVLELGFGTGHLMVELSRTRRCAAGADASPAMAARAAWRLRKAGQAAGVVQADSQALPYGENVFDTVLSTFPTAFIVREDTLLECARVTRVLADGEGPGRLVVAGLWADTDCRLLRLVFAPFYGAPNWAFLGDYMEVLRRAGYAPALFEDAEGIFRIGTVVAITKAPAS